MSTVYLYRLYCIEEATFVTVWAQEEPTICPHDHTDRTIDSDQTTIINNISKGSVVTEEPTSGYFQATTIEVDVPAGATGDITTLDIVFPMDIELWKTVFYAKDSMVGDVINIIVAPDSIIGTLTQDTIPSDPVLNVSNTVIDSGVVQNGVHITLDNTVTTENLGRVINIDNANYKLTMENTPVASFLAGTLVRLNICTIYNYIIDYANKLHRFGEKGFKSKRIPANLISRLMYTNNNGQAKKFQIIVEYYYQ